VLLKQFDYVTIEPHTIATAARDVLKDFDARNVAKYPTEGAMTVLAVVPIFSGRGFKSETLARAFERKNRVQ
jgi:hypothetical protein